VCVCGVCVWCVCVRGVRVCVCVCGRIRTPNDERRKRGIIFKTFVFKMYILNFFKVCVNQCDNCIVHRREI